MKNEIHPLLRERYSPMGFTNGPITDAQIETMIEAASWSPSAYNDQPWRFAWTLSGSREFEKVLGCFVEYNQQWASSAACYIVVMHSRNLGHNQQPNHHAAYDTGAAAMALIVQAMSTGIYAHQLAGFDQQAMRSLLSVDDSISLISVIALGYPAEPDSLLSPFKEKAKAIRVRKPISEIGHKIKL